MSHAVAGQRRVGFLGGTFDPPHHGHLAVARAAAQALGLDEVRLLVAGDPWMKAGRSPAHHRLAMARLAVHDSTARGHVESDHGILVEVDDREVRRGGPTYTIVTLEELRDSEPNVHAVLLLGWDAALTLPSWRRCADVLRLTEIVVFRRPGVEGSLAPEVASVAQEISVPAYPISSTALRRRVAEGLDVADWVAAPVVAYIAEHGLYRRVL